MKSFIRIILILSVLPAFAQVTTRGGGGYTIAPDGRPVLLEILNPNLCPAYEIGRDFLAKNEISYWPKLLNHLKLGSNEYAEHVKNEGNRILICQVEDISKVLDYLHVTKKKMFYEEGLGYVAYRYDEDNRPIMYLSTPVWKKMTERMKAILFLHEITHSFIPMSIPEDLRTAKLMAIIKYIEANELNLKEEDFKNQMDIAEITFPESDIIPTEKNERLDLLGKAIIENKLNLIERLFESNMVELSDLLIEPKSKCQMDAIQLAAYYGRAKVVQVLLFRSKFSKGMDLNRRTEKNCFGGKTALMLALEYDVGADEPLIDLIVHLLASHPQSDLCTYSHDGHIAEWYARKSRRRFLDISFERKEKKQECRESSSMFKFKKFVNHLY